MGNQMQYETGQIGAYEMQLCCIAVGYGSFDPPCGNTCCFLWPFLICIPTCCCAPSHPAGPLWTPVDKNRWKELLREAEATAASARSDCCNNNPWKMKSALDSN